MSMFDEQWMARVADSAPAMADVTAVVDIVLSTGRGADRTFHVTTQDGVVVAAADGLADASDLSITISPADAEAIVKGELAVGPAFMQGRLKPAGDNELWLRMAKSATTSSTFTSWCAALR